MLTIDTIIGSKLDEICLVQYSGSEDAYWTESVVLKFQNIHYVINVNEDTDEVEILLHDESQALTQDQFQVDNGNVIKISERPDSSLFKLLGSKLTWVWEMTNNQGYSDGIQFQFNCKKNNIVQFIAMASRLQINMLSSTETPSI
jgi:hypothetical protein